MRKWEIFGEVSFVNYTLVIFIEIDHISNTNFVQLSTK